MVEILPADHLADDYLDKGYPYFFEWDKNAAKMVVDVPDDILESNGFDVSLGRRDVSLRDFWTSSAYRNWVDVNVEGVWGCLWPCMPKQSLMQVVSLMAKHVPDVIIAYVPTGTLLPDVGFAIRGDEVEFDISDRPKVALRIGVAYICSGFLPPTKIALEAFQSDPDIELDARILEGFRTSLDRAKTIANTAEDHFPRNWGPCP